jgi:hypothetical protein
MDISTNIVFSTSFYLMYLVKRSPVTMFLTSVTALHFHFMFGTFQVKDIICFPFVSLIRAHRPDLALLDANGWIGSHLSNTSSGLDSLADPIQRSD